VRQVVFYTNRGIPALNVKFRNEPLPGQEIAVYTAKWIARNLGKEVSTAAATLGTKSCPQGKSASLAARYGDCRRWVKGDRIGFAMNGLAVVAMADVLRHRFAGQLYLDGTATTSNMGDGHWFISLSGCPAASMSS
jgi:hypothetical protein